MVDLYTVIVPIFGVLALLHLLALKLSIKDVVTMTIIRQKSQLVNQQKLGNQEESPTKNTIKHMLMHFTPLEICAVRRAKYKLCLFLSLSLIAIGTYFFPSPFYFIPTGTVVFFAYFLVAMAITRSNSEENDGASQKYKEKYLQVILTIFSIALNVTMIGLVFKMYQNSMLLTFLGNFGLNIVFDNFVARPTFAIILGIPLSFNSSVYDYVMECQKQEQMLETYETVGEKEMLTRVQKMMSHSQIAKNIPLQVEIEKPDSKGYLRREDEERPIDILKKIKREKLLPPINMNLQQTDQDFSLNSLFASSKKDENSNMSEDHHFEEKVSNEEPILPIKTNGCSENLILINPSLQEEINNEEDIVTEHITTNKITENDEEYNESFRQKGATFNVGDSNEPLRISLNNSENPTSRQEPLRICLNGQINLDFQENQSDEDDDVDNYRKRKELMTLDDATNKNPNFGLLEIKEKNNINQSEEIEEIDLNSPEKRRRQGLHIEYEVESKMSGIPKKKKKKLSHDNPRIVKFSTGEPYLQYLPNMLSKDAKTKKSQAISRKELIMDSRVVNSVKRPPKKKVFGEHNQNIVPEFNIEEM